jgi:hypothetical protein
LGRGFGLWVGGSRGEQRQKQDAKSGGNPQQEGQTGQNAQDAHGTSRILILAERFGFWPIV